MRNAEDAYRPGTFTDQDARSEARQDVRQAVKQSGRQQLILNTLARHGYVSIDALAEELGVSTQTVRRDINALDENGLLERKPGGAIPRTRNIVNSSYSARQYEDVDEKERIGRAIAALVPDNCSIFLTLGTTIETVAMHLLERSGLMIVTNNTVAALILNKKTDFEVVLASGYMRKSSNGLVGASTVEFANGFHCDYLITSTGGINEQDGHLLDYHTADVSVAQTMMRNSQKTILAVSAKKFGRHAVVRVAPLKKIDYLVTGTPVPSRLKVLTANAGVHLVEA